MGQVCHGHAPVVIKRKGKASVVMMSLKEYQAMEETTYLLRSPANARNLLESIAELEMGKG
jgi:antitoxin YefM